jgi:putative transposase
MTRPKNKVANSRLPDHLQAELQHAVDGGLGEMSLRPLLSMLLSSVFEAERRQYLQQAPEDKGNGAYGRRLNLGSMPLNVSVPRTRSGRFRPATLPQRYQRSYPEEIQSVLFSLMSSSRSLSAAKDGLRKMGLPVPESEIDAIANDVVQDIELRNTGPVEPDQLALYMDAKYVEWRQGDRLAPACIYVVIGIGQDGMKRVLACEAHTGRETIEQWKKVLKSLLMRGLRRVLIVIHDDLPGLLKQTSGLFPGADVQLCIVHMQRNAKRHLPKVECTEFMRRLKTIKACWSTELAAAQYEEMCDRFADVAPNFIAGIRKKRRHYLAFLAYPEQVRPAFSTTNAVEAVNSVLENIRRNNGGYFHSEHVLKLKLGFAIAHLEEGSWRKVTSQVGAALSGLNAMFEERFDGEL